jgi:hypothetical protein
MSLLPEVRQSASKGDCSQAVSNVVVGKFFDCMYTPFFIF